MTDRLYWSFPWGEIFYKCRIHNVPYPKGAVCPKCKYEEDVKDTDNEN